MYQVLAYIYITIVIISFLCSLISFRLHYPFHLKLFSVFLGITALTEITANFLLTPLHLNSNYPVYNIFLVIQFPFLAFYFKQVITSKAFRKGINTFFLCYPVLWLVIILFVYGLNKWNSYGIMAGDLFVIAFAGRYLYELFTAEQLISFRKNSEFWIAIAIIFYSCCELPIMGILNFLVRDWNNTLKLLTILQLLNIIMYSIFIYAYLCRIKSTGKK
jgi:hypothetical protein